MKAQNLTPKQSKSLAPVSTDKEQQGGKTMSPPPFQLMASSSAPAQRAAAPAAQQAASGTTAQLKEDPKPYKVDKKVPELENGANQTGPIAASSIGDTNDFAAKDVNQGALGDCWLLASLMALAGTSPDVLKNAITGPKGDGSYDVKLYKKGGGFLSKTTYTAETVNVQPSFVTYKASGTHAYASGGDTDAAGNEELWVKLIEKAYAKWKGSYKKIDGGWSENALEALTGQSYTQHGFGSGFLGLGSKTDAELSKEITDAIKAGSPLTASTKGDGAIARADKDEGGFAKANDIIGRHEYAIIKADATNITVRNPWGSNAANAEPTLTWSQFKKFFSGYTSKD